jgi:hypothetical protein
MRGSFESIMSSQCYKNLFHVTKFKKKNKNKNNVLIYPHIHPIQEEVKRRKIKNLNEGNDRLVLYRKGEPLHRSRRPKEVEVVSVSESLSRKTSKARALSDSVQVSERLDMVITRANPKEVSK